MYIYVYLICGKKKRDCYCSLGELMSTVVSAAFFSQDNGNGEMTTQENLQNNSNNITIWLQAV